MKISSRSYLSIAVLSALVGVAQYFGVAISTKTTSEVSDMMPCLAKTVNLPDGAPPELVAVLSQNCAAFMADHNPDMRLSLAQDYGYPSLMWGHFPVDEVIKSWSALVDEGDHEYFRNDADIQAIVLASSLSNTVKAFVVSATEKSRAPINNIDLSLWATTLPIWNDRDASEQLMSACNANNCKGPPTRCPENVGLEDKLLVASGAKTLAEVVNDCPLTVGWLVALRRGGMIDTTCTSTLHINRIINQGLNPTKACFSEDNRTSGTSVSTSADILRQLRFKLMANPSSLPDPAAAADLQLYYPQINDFYTSRTK
jgi:hypothetical protein